MSLTVSDIERLAKAGVTMAFNDIVHTIVPDYGPPPGEPAPSSPRTLEDAFWERWRRAHTKHDPYGFEGMHNPYIVHCHERGDKVFVMLCSQNEDPFIIEDSAPLFPSDALMAKCALYEKVKP